MQLFIFGHTCGGSILDESNVLTAAHCCQDQTPNRLSVRAGEFNLNQDEGPEQVRLMRILFFCSEDPNILWNQGEMRNKMSYNVLMRAELFFFSPDTLISLRSEDECRIVLFCNSLHKQKDPRSRFYRSEKTVWRCTFFKREGHFAFFHYATLSDFQEVDVAEIIIHPGWDATQERLQNDICILRLAEPLTFNE